MVKDLVAIEFVSNHFVFFAEFSETRLILGTINTMLLFVCSRTISGVWHFVRHYEEHKSNEISRSYPYVAYSLERKIRYSGQP